MPEISTRDALVSATRCVPLVTSIPCNKCITNISILKKVVAEFIGTCIMIFGAAAAPIVDQKYHGAETLVGNATSAGLAVMIVIISIGHISGAHLNPSVTIAFAVIGHFSRMLVPRCPFASIGINQCLLRASSTPSSQAGNHILRGHHATTQAFFLEAVITFILMFVITAVATDSKGARGLAAIASGAAVSLNILVAGPLTGGSMNPVRTLGPAIATGNYKQIWIYFVAPIVVAVAGAATSAGLKLKGNEPIRRHNKA